MDFRKDPCVSCLTGYLSWRLIKETIKQEHNGQEVEVISNRIPVLVCDQCGEVIITGETLRVRQDCMDRELKKRGLT